MNTPPDPLQKPTDDPLFALQLKNIPKTESIEESPRTPRTITPTVLKYNVGEFYIAQRRKINIWTFLFKELTKSIEQILYMCEIENKLEFCKGVRETFKKSTRELDKIEQKIKLESGH